MLVPDQLLLAILTGVACGYVATLVDMHWRTLMTWIVILFVLQTFAQMLWRISTGHNTWEDLAIVTVNRLAFTVAACLLVWAWEKRR